MVAVISVFVVIGNIERDDTFIVNPIHFPNYLDSEQNKIGYAVKNLMRRNMIELLSKRLMCLFRIRPRRLSKFIFASNDKRYQPLPCL